MDALGWQKHQKENGTVHSVLLPWREEAVGTNKDGHFIWERVRLQLNILYGTLKRRKEEEDTVHFQATT